MVRRRLRAAALISALAAASACGNKERETAERVEMPDSMPIVRAMKDAEARDAMLDTMPGGEMARGDSLAEMKLLEKKM